MSCAPPKLADYVSLYVSIYYNVTKKKKNDAETLMVKLRRHEPSRCDTHISGRHVSQTFKKIHQSE